MSFAGHPMRWGYVCTRCGSSQRTGSRVFVVNAPGGSPGCTDAEYLGLRRELEERNRQRDDLVFKIKDLRDHNKKYKERLETQESSKRQQQHVLQKTHTTQLADRDRLISSLQDIIEEHERKILQLEAQTHGRTPSGPDDVITTSASTSTSSSPTSTTNASCVANITSTTASSTSGSTARLISEVQRLQDEKSKLASQLAEAQVVTQIVYVEVDSEGLKSQVAESQDRVTWLEQEVLHWETKCADRDQTVATLHKQLETLTAKLEESVEERKLHECLLEEVEKEHQERDDRHEAEKKIYELQMANQHMRLKLMHLQSSFEGVQHSYALLSRQARQFPGMMSVVIKDIRDEMLKVVTDVAQENKDLVRKYHKEMHLRKKYHNELVELKGNIRVFCRVRPPIKEDGTGPQAEVVMTYDPDDDGMIYVGNKGRIHTFEFDKVFSDTSTQTEVFEEVRALVTCCIDGFNVCIFAYGQTGSGKTFTMEGPGSDPGINQRALQELFKETAERGQDWHYMIEVSVLEIYNETIRDLLSTDSANKLDVKMKAEGGGYHVPGLHTVAVSSLQDINEVFAFGRKNRATATTNMNEHSSRSHCLLCVTITGVNRITGTRSFGRLNLVDLAGTERVNKSGADGARLKEAQNINKSLACLGDVIHALRIKQNHIPFRNSKLTYLLQDSLGGDSKTLMIVQVAPVEKNVAESTCSLTFGQRMRNVELGAATCKIESGDLELKSPSSPIILGTPPSAKKLAQSARSPVTSTQRFPPSKTSTPATSSAKATPRSTRQVLRRK